MNRCDPVEMRKNLLIVKELERAMIDFVPIPVKNASDKAALQAKLTVVLSEMGKSADKDVP